MLTPTVKSTPSHRSRAGADDLSRTALRTISVLKEVETLGIARSLGWRVHMRCPDGYREGTSADRAINRVASSFA